MPELAASNVLTVVAEIAIALAGFAGIVGAFRQRGLEAFEPHEALRLHYMLLVACETLDAALLPFVPHDLATSPTRTWALSSAVLAVGLLGHLLLLCRRTLPHRPQLSRVWFGVCLVGSVLAGLLVAANALGGLGDPGPGPYLAGLGWKLFYAMSIFVQLVLSPFASLG
jgi:hypothetical protein